MSDKDDLTVGIVGGMGPEATLDLFAKILGHTAARTDQEHLRLIIDNDPKVPNRHDAIAGRIPSVGPRLAATACGLERAGADFVVMACNTAHAFEADVRAALTVPFVSIIEETCNEVLRRVGGAASVGLLAAKGCLDAGLYQKALAGHGIEVVVPAETERFMKLLYAIKSGDRAAPVRAAMRGLAGGLVERGAAAIIAGCTEVPLVLSDGDLAAPVIDSTDVLARRCVAYARYREPLPAR